MNFTIREILDLEKEINGYQIDNQIIFEGFINQKLPILLKYKLFSFSKRLIEERDKIGELRNELIIKYGEEKDGSHVITQLSEETNELNKNYELFIIEYNTLLDNKIDIEVPEININDIASAGSTIDNYNILFKIIK